MEKKYSIKSNTYFNHTKININHINKINIFLFISYKYLNISNKNLRYLIFEFL